jgi:hypothetical protein
MGVGGHPHDPAASTPWKDPVPIQQEAGWAPGPVWTGGKSRLHRDSIPDRPAHSSVAIPTELPNGICYSCKYFQSSTSNVSVGNATIRVVVPENNYKQASVTVSH